MERNHYDILQIKPDATADEIQRAYRRQALKFHPDRNPAPDAAARMAAINEAYEVLRDAVQPPSERSSRRAEPTAQGKGPAEDLTFSILSAARAVILRSGWSLSEDNGRTAVFAYRKERIHIVLTDRLTKESLLRSARQYGNLAAVLAVHIEAPIAVGSRLTVIDLMRAERHGALIPDGPCKSLLSSFL